MTAWWHRRQGHTQQVNRHITVPTWDRSAKGVLIRCSCGKVWAK